MSKKSHKRAVPVSPPSPLKRVERWLGRRSRLARSIIGLLISMITVGIVGVLIYGYFLDLPPGALNIGSMSPTDFLTALLIVLTILGLILYGIGWRLFLGFGG